MAISVNITLFSQESFKYFDLKTLRWGVLNTHGKKIVEPEYSSIYKKHGFYILQYDNGHYGLVDTNGVRILGRNYYSINVVDKDSIYVKDYALCGILNSSMEWIFKSDGESIHREHDYYLLQGKTDVKVLNSKFEQLMPWFVASILKNPKNDKFTFRIQKNNLFGLVNEKGEIIIPPDYAFLDLISFDDNIKYLLGIKLLKTDLQKYPHGKNNIVFDLNGNVVFDLANEGLKFLSSNKIALRNENGLWGVFDLEKNRLIDCMYLELYPLGKHLFFVQNSYKKWGVVNDKNEVVQPFEFIDPLSYGGGTAYLTNKKGIKVKNHTKKYALLSVSGVLLTDFKYDEIWNSNMHVRNFTP